MLVYEVIVMKPICNNLNGMVKLSFVLTSYYISNV